MDAVYRNKENEEYWERRWADTGADTQSFNRLDFYPIKFAEEVMSDVPKSAKCLEAGCGPGRLFFHYREQGYDITGVDFSTNAIEHIKEIDPDADAKVADVRDLSFPDETFDVVMAFGLFHNFEDPNDLVRALSETIRVLKTGGQIVLSVRCDSTENYLIEYLTNRGKTESTNLKFHKLHFTESDLQYLLSGNGTTVQNIEFARNVSFMFKFDSLRAPSMREGEFDESIARAEGFKLNAVGQTIDSLLHRLLPKHFSNVLVATAKKEP